MEFPNLNDNFLKKTPRQRPVEVGAVVEYAEEAVAEILGKDKINEAKPLFLKNRTLTITCSSSAMAQEVCLHQQEILDKINQKLGKTEVDRIRYLL